MFGERGVCAQRERCGEPAGAYVVKVRRAQRAPAAAGLVGHAMRVAARGCAASTRRCGGPQISGRPRACSGAAWPGAAVYWPASGLGRRQAAQRGRAARSLSRAAPPGCRQAAPRPRGALVRPLGAFRAQTWSLRQQQRPGAASAPSVYEAASGWGGQPARARQSTADPLSTRTSVAGGAAGACVGRLHVRWSPHTRRARRTRVPPPTVLTAPIASASERRAVARRSQAPRPPPCCSCLMPATPHPPPAGQRG